MKASLPLLLFHAAVVRQVAAAAAADAKNSSSPTLLPTSNFDRRSEDLLIVAHPNARAITSLERRDAAHSGRLHTRSPTPLVAPPSTPDGRSSPPPTGNEGPWSPISSDSEGPVAPYPSPDRGKGPASPSSTDSDRTMSPLSSSGDEGSWRAARQGPLPDGEGTSRQKPYNRGRGPESLSSSGTEEFWSSLTTDSGSSGGEVPGRGRRPSSPVVSSNGGEPVGPSSPRPDNRSKGPEPLSSSDTEEFWSSPATDSGSPGGEVPGRGRRPPSPRPDDRGKGPASPSSSSSEESPRRVLNDGAGPSGRRPSFSSDEGPSPPGPSRGRIPASPPSSGGEGPSSPRPNDRGRGSASPSPSDTEGSWGMLSTDDEAVSEPGRRPASPRPLPDPNRGKGPASPGSSSRGSTNENPTTPESINYEYYEPRPISRSGTNPGTTRLVDYFAASSPVEYSEDLPTRFTPAEGEQFHRPRFCYSVRGRGQYVSSLTGLRQDTWLRAWCVDVMRGDCWCRPRDRLDCISTWAANECTACDCSTRAPLWKPKTNFKSPKRRIEQVIPVNPQDPNGW